MKKPTHLPTTTDFRSPVRIPTPLKPIYNMLHFNAVFCVYDLLFYFLQSFNSFLVNMRPKHDITKEIMLTNVVVAVFLKLYYLKKIIQTDSHTHIHTHTLAQ